VVVGPLAELKKRERERKTEKETITRTEKKIVGKEKKKGGRRSNPDYTYLRA